MTMTHQRQQALLHTVLGPIAPLLADPATVEVLINPDGQLWCERQGTPLVSTGDVFASAQVEALICTVAGLSGLACTTAQPSVSAVLPGSGARFQGMIPPATAAPSCVIRRPAARIYTLDEYVQAQVMAPWQATTLRDAVATKQNILIAGATGTGKTTLLNTLLALMATERVITIEDTREVVASERRQPLYTSAERPMAVLLREALRLRPDRLIVGEVRGVEAIDLLDAWGTGHPGGVATVHAGTPQEALTRLETCVRQVSPVHPQPLPLAVARPLIASTIHLIACLVRTDTGRRVSALARVNGLQGDAYHLTVLEDAA